MLRLAQLWKKKAFLGTQQSWKRKYKWDQGSRGSNSIYLFIFLKRSNLIQSPDIKNQLISYKYMHDLTITSTFYLSPSTSKGTILSKLNSTSVQAHFQYVFLESIMTRLCNINSTSSHPSPSQRHSNSNHPKSF